MSEKLPVKKTDSINEKIKEIEDRITQRAHDIFLGNGGMAGNELEDWLQAERELVWKPAIKVEERDNCFDIKVALPGIDPKDFDIEVTPAEILVKADFKHEHKEEFRTVHACEFSSGHLFRVIQLPKKINPDKVKAELKHGLLHLTAQILEEAPAKKVKVATA